MWVRAQCSVILYCSCNLFLFSVLHQTTSVFWAPLLLALASIKHAGSVPGADFLLQLVNIFRSARAMLQARFCRSLSTENTMLTSAGWSLSFHIHHSVPRPFCTRSCSLTCSPLLAIWRHSYRVRPLDVHSLLHLQESYPKTNNSFGVVRFKINCGCFSFVPC